MEALPVGSLVLLVVGLPQVPGISSTAIDDWWALSRGGLRTQRCVLLVSVGLQVLGRASPHLSLQSWRSRALGSDRPLDAQALRFDVADSLHQSIIGRW